MFTTSRGFVYPKFVYPKLSRTFCSSLLACLSAAALSAAPQLRLSTTAVGPIYVESGINSPAQSINAYNIGDGSLNLSVTSSASWLSASVGASQNCSGGPVPTCLPIRINVSTSTLSVGTYTESITVSDPTAIDSPQNITVTVQVNGAPMSALDLYVTPAGGPASTASVNVNTGNTVQSSIRTSDNTPWLSFSLAGGGSFSFFTPYQLTAIAQPGQNGDYTGTVALSGSANAADNKTINVNLHVTSAPILQINPITLNLIQGQFQPTNISFQNIGLGTLSITGVTLSLPGVGSFPTWLTAQVASSTSVAILPGATNIVVPPGVYLATLTLQSNAANTATAIPVRITVSAATPPMLSVGGIVDNAAFAGGQAVGSGTIAAIFGSQFSATGPAFASTVPLPTTLAGIQVLVNGVPAPLFYVDASQADIQIPFGLTGGQMTIQVVRNGQAGNIISGPVDSIAPRLFALRGFPAAPDSSPYGIILNATDNTLALPVNLVNGVASHPAHRGDVITIYTLGLGPVTQNVATGSGAPGAEPLARLTNPVDVFFGGGFLGFSKATPDYAGLAPNFVGLYQINVTIPQDAPLGNVPVMLSMPGHASNFVEMAIDPSPAASSK